MDLLRYIQACAGYGWRSRADNGMTMERHKKGYGLPERTLVVIIEVFAPEKRSTISEESRRKNHVRLRDNYGFQFRCTSGIY